MPAPLILASGSPRRRELLTRIGIAIEVIPPSVDETPRVGEDALPYARRVAQEKARAVASEHPTRWVLAADTVVAHGGRILGKAADEGQARGMLSSLLGTTHEVITAFAIAGPGAEVSCRAVATQVTMREAIGNELADYVAAGEWCGKAGAYAVQGMAGAFVERVEGSVTNVIGLPLCEVAVELSRLGAAQPGYRAGVPA